MTINKLVFVCALAMAACGGKKDGATTTPGADTTGDGQPCSQEVALECDEGMIDACLKTPPEGDTHICVDE